MNVVDWIFIIILSTIVTYFFGRAIAGPLPWFEPKRNAKRVRNKFLFFPIKDSEENRYWLERVKIEEHYWDGYYGGGFGDPTCAGWQIDKVTRINKIDNKETSYVVVGEMVKRETCKTYRWNQERLEYSNFKNLTNKESKDDNGQRRYIE